MIRTASGAFCVLTLVGLMTTGSRGGGLAFLFSMGTYLLVSHRHRLIGLPAVFLIIFSVFLVAVGSYAFAPSQIKDKMKERFDPMKSEDVSAFTSGRTVIWRNGLRLVKASPVFGHGQNTFVELMEKKFKMSVNSHNDYLLYLVNYGVVGLLVFLGIFLKVFQHVRRQLLIAEDHWSKRLYLSYLAGFAGYTFAMLGVNVMEPRYSFWIYTAIVYQYPKIKDRGRA